MDQGLSLEDLSIHPCNQEPDLVNPLCHEAFELECRGAESRSEVR